MNNIINRRRHKRIALGHLNVQAKTVLSSECKILDMGLKGVCIATTHWLSLNNSYSIKFNLDEKRISNKGTVRWVKLVGNKKEGNLDSMPVYMTGMEFETVLTESGKDIARVLTEFSENGEKRLSGHRVKLKNNGKAVFNVLHEYPIRQISSGGMLVETEHELRLGEIFSWAFNFPEDVNIIRCRGRITSRIESFSTNRKRYHAGVQFVAMEKEDRIKLARFVMKAMISGLKAPSLH